MHSVSNQWLLFLTRLLLSLQSHELIRIAILWNEQWHKGLEEASRLYFGDNQVAAMMDVLIPLHKMMGAGAKTMREMNFQQTCGTDLAEAYEWLMQYNMTHKKADLDQVRHGCVVVRNSVCDMLLTVLLLLCFCGGVVRLGTATTVSFATSTSSCHS